jgi:hypothetical protein
MTNTRKKFTSLLVAASLSLGMIAATPTPAHAASQVSGCFRHYRGGTGNLVGVTVQLQAATVYGWVAAASTTLGPTGCVTWNIAPDLQGYHLRIVANHRVSGMYFYGSSGITAGPGYGPVPLGTANVYCNGCPAW